jgi:anti-sigma factor RsiW
MCPDHDILSAYIDGEIASPWERAIADHIASCERCHAVHARLLAARRALREEPPEDASGPMERVRQRILSHAPPVQHAPPVWRRQVSLPIPVAALAAALLLTLGVTLAVLVARSNMGFVRITKSPASGTEYQFAVPYDKVEALLKSLGDGDSNIESVMTLPKDVRLTPVGQPRMVRETDLLRKKP